MSNKPKLDLAKLTDTQIYDRVAELAREVEKLNNIARQRGSIKVPAGMDTYFLDEIGFHNYWQPSMEWQGSSC